MPDVNVNCCESLNISSVNFNCNKNRKKSVEFNLMEQEENKQCKFDNLLPENDNYLYIKILKNERIVAIEGKLCKNFHMKKKDILNNHLQEIKFHKEFFLDFIKPLFDISISKGDSFQFMFLSSEIEEEFVCSIYPCCIPGDHISSVDIVVRNPQNTITDVRTFKIVSEN